MSPDLSEARVQTLYFYFYRGEGREKERERNVNMWLPIRGPPTGDPAHNPGMCPDWEWNRRRFGSQAGTQSTEPHQTGPEYKLLN